MSDKKEAEEIYRPSWKAAVPPILALACAFSAVWAVAATKPRVVVELIANAASRLRILAILQAIYPFVPYALIAIFAAASAYLLRYTFTTKYVLSASGITCREWKKNRTVPGEEISGARIALQSKIYKMLNVANVFVLHETGRRETELLRISKPKELIEKLERVAGQSKKKEEEELRKALEAVEEAAEEKEREERTEGGGENAG